jgi:hypothetical protein
MGWGDLFTTLRRTEAFTQNEGSEMLGVGVLTTGATMVPQGIRMPASTRLRNNHHQRRMIKVAAYGLGT